MSRLLNPGRGRVSGVERSVNWRDALVDLLIDLLIDRNAATVMGSCKVCFKRNAAVS